MNSIALFINGELGMELIEVIQTREKICQLDAIVINGEQKYTRDYHDKVANHPFVLGSQVPVFVYSKDMFDSEEFKFATSRSTLGASALFGHLIPNSFIQATSMKLINLHPSLLPLGRGSDPVAWSIIEARPQGATIHEVTEKLDSGGIISQEQIYTDLSISAGEIYLLALNSLKRQFIEYLLNDDKTIISTPQEGPQSYHGTKELKELRKSLLIDSRRLEESIRIIQALTYNDGRAAIIRATDGSLWEITVKLKRISSEE